MAKTTGNKDQVYVEVGEGKRARRIASVPFIIAQDRATIDTDSHLLADLITAENATAVNKAIFIAPCKGKIIKVSANAVAYPDNGQAATTITIDVLKAVIADTDVSVLSSALAIEGGTANTAIHGTLSTTSGALDFLEGQLIYAQADVSNNSITPRSDGLVVTVEWYPTER